MSAVVGYCYRNTMNKQEALCLQQVISFNRVWAARNLK